MEKTLVRSASLSERVEPIFENRQPEVFSACDVGDRIPDLLQNVIYEHNYDTFSFMFELLEKGESIKSAFESLDLDSIDHIDKYNGSNCAGLALKLAQDLRTHLGVDSIVIPSFGEIFPEPPDSAYAGVKTAALLVTDDSHQKYMLEPALAVGSVIPILGENDPLLVSDTLAQASTSDNDTLIKLFFPGKNGVRELHFQNISLENANGSMQKNWIRSRSKYKIERRRRDGGKDTISYSFNADSFTVRLGELGVHASLEPASMEEFTSEHADAITKTFGTDSFISGIKRFIDNRQKIVDELLIEPVKKDIA